MDKWHASPYFLVPDIVSISEWYRDKLDFKYEKLWGEPPSFVMVVRNNVRIMLAEVSLAKKYPDMIHPNRKSDHHAWDIYIDIGEGSLEDLQKEFEGKGVRITSSISLKEYYGMWEFEIEDPNGYVLCFAKDATKK